MIDMGEDYRLNISHKVTERLQGLGGMWSDVMVSIEERDDRNWDHPKTFVVLYT